MLLQDFSYYNTNGRSVRYMSTFFFLKERKRKNDMIWGLPTLWSPTHFCGGGRLIDQWSTRGRVSPCLKVGPRRVQFKLHVWWKLEKSAPKAHILPAFQFALIYGWGGGGGYQLWVCREVKDMGPFSASSV